jgi:hypothetical protein
VVLRWRGEVHYQEGEQSIRKMVRGRKGSKLTKQLYIVIEGRRREFNKICTVFGMRRGSN